jgi:KTSC domain
MEAAMKEVKSGSISHVGYDPQTSQMTIKFHNGGTYTYEGVSEAEHKALLEAPSIGKHFTQHVRNKRQGLRAA